MLLNRPVTVTDVIPELEALLSAGKLAIFGGSGISVSKPTDLPAWDGFLEKFIEICEKLQNSLKADLRFTEELADARRHILKSPARVASVLKRKIVEAQKKAPESNITPVLRDWFTDVFAGKPENDYHRAIVATKYPVILTSNYDTLLEKAALAGGFSDLLVSSFSFNDADKIASALYSRRSSIIHVHGDLKSVPFEDLIFTAEDFVRIQKKYSGFTMALNTVFMTSSVLFVGYGASDPHLEALIEEMAFFFEWSSYGDGWTGLSDVAKYFLVLKRDKVDAILHEYKHQLRTRIVAIDDYGEVLDLLNRLRAFAPR